MKFIEGKRDLAKLAASVTACILAGGFGSLFTYQAVPTWYRGLAKPSFTPPDWLFGPVWTLLYIMMGISLYLVWKRGWSDPKVRFSILVFFFQLVLNSIWSLLFFGFRSPMAGLIGIIFLWIAIKLTIWNFYEVSRGAAWLLIPYSLWVTFAAVLNYFIWSLNR